MRPSDLPGFCMKPAARVTQACGSRCDSMTQDYSSEVRCTQCGRVPLADLAVT